jgi:hypothetical protein
VRANCRGSKISRTRRSQAALSGKGALVSYGTGTTQTAQLQCVGERDRSLRDKTKTKSSLLVSSCYDCRIAKSFPRCLTRSYLHIPMDAAVSLATAFRRPPILTTLVAGYNAGMRSPKTNWPSQPIGALEFDLNSGSSLEEVKKLRNTRQIMS